MKQVFAVARISVMALLMIGTIACSSDKKEASAGDEAAKPTTPAAAPEAPDTPDTPAEIVADAEGAKAIFASRCEACHGASGKGDGPGAAAITPKPRDYTSAEWQASVSDEDIALAIVKGGLAVGKSAVMPGNPELKDKPAIVKGLVDIIRDFEQ